MTIVRNSLEVLGRGRLCGSSNLRTGTTTFQATALSVVWMVHSRVPVNPIGRSMAFSCNVAFVGAMDPRENDILLICIPGQRKLFFGGATVQIQDPGP